MLDLEGYFAQMNTRLRACQGHIVSQKIEGPHVKLTGHEIKTTLNIDIEWNTGELLSAGDYWTSRQNETWHEFSYQFMDGNKGTIFRLDSHGRLIKHSAPCHIHIGSQVMEHGNSGLRGFDLTSITLIHAWELIYLHLTGNRMPWEI